MKREGNLQLGSFRQVINQIDNDIIDLIEARFALMPDLGKFKKENNLPLEHKERELEIYEKYKKLASEKGIDAKVLVKIFFNIIEESKKIQGDNM
ncbi:chorismate mutase [Candidatus Gracilibacteria bacterium]|nr:chorismate mutase [Candidatus Gracilibacteria bacterium]